MSHNFILSILITLVLLSNGQQDDDRDLSQDVQQPIRSSKSSFDAQFYRGQCPDRFYQLGDECVYFATGRIRYSWHQTQRVCARQVARLSKQQSILSNSQSNTTPTKGVRQLTLNTPDKVKILEALYRDYDEMNFAVHVPDDYNTLNRCRDGKGDLWPQYCSNSKNSSATCFETVTLNSNSICLNQKDCSTRDYRLACEFTLPGSPEIVASKFRHCPKVRGLRHRLSIWAWLLVAVGAMLLLLLILGGVLAFLRKSKNASSTIEKSGSEPYHNDNQVISIPSTREDPAAEPMLVRAAPTNVSDTGYLEPLPLKRVAPPTITKTTGGHEDTHPNV